MFVSIPQPKNFSFTECLWFLDRDLDDVSHRVEGAVVKKVVVLEQRARLIQVHEENNAVIVSVLKGGKVTARSLENYVRDWLDMDRDIAPFYRLLNTDHDLAWLGRKFRGLRVVGIPELFELLCWCVIGQQINLDFAYTIKRRLVEKYGSSLQYQGEKYWLFPAPETISHLKITDLRALQMTGKKAEYLIGIAGLVLRGNLSKEKLLALEGEELMLKELMKIRGIGEWTANYTAMKGLHAMNGVPYGDSGINNALFNLKNIPKKNNRGQVDAVFRKFEGWKTYLVYYLWRSLREPNPLSIS